MRKTIVLITLFVTSFKLLAQDSPTPTGYKLKESQSIIYAYRNQNDKPDLTVRNRWNHKYWFKTDNSNKGTFTDATTKEKFIRITIISENRFDDNKNDWTSEKGYNTLVQWKDEEYIDGSDFNTWLWIRQSDFDSLKYNYSSSIKGTFVLSGLTVPFKYRPAISGQSNSLINGDINLGSFIGWRLAKNENFGLSLGGHFGITSISLNAANNSGITGTNTETIQGFNYGYGAVIDLKKKFQIGFVVGYDYGLGNLSKTYVYQQKSWYSFSLNYNFLDFGKKDSDSNKKEGEKAQKDKAK